jgi:hypothetical protein
MAAKWPAMMVPKGSLLHNDDSHNFTDPNQGGGPAAPVQRNSLRVPDSQKGGMGMSGRPVRGPMPSLAGRGGTGNPASRGSVTPVGRQSFPSEVRNPGHGGSVQTRNPLGAPPAHRGGFGRSGQQGVPSYPHANPQPKAGNLASRMSQRISGHFNNASKKNPNRGMAGGNRIDRGPSRGSGI